MAPIRAARKTRRITFRRHRGGKNPVVGKDKTLAKFLPGVFRSEGARGAGRPEKPETEAKQNAARAQSAAKKRNP